MKTVIEALEEIIPIGKHCNPDTSYSPDWGKESQDCPFHDCGIYCSLHEEMVGNIKCCEINMEKIKED